MRREFSATVQREIVGRATGGDGVVSCERCGLRIKGHAFEIDHVIPEGLVPEWRKDKKLTALEGQLLCLSCHRGDKTPQDVKQIAKAKRQYDKAHGLKRTKQKIASRGFPKAERPEPKPVPPPRAIYSKAANGESDEDTSTG